MKKILLTLLFAILLTVSVASASVSQTISFVNEQGAALGGQTTIAYYNVMSNGNVIFQREETAMSTGGVITYPTDMPAGVSSYLIFFMKDGFLPWAMENNYAGNGAVQYTVPFTQAEYAHAPIRQFSATNVESLGQPLLIDVEAALAGNVYSAFTRVDNGINPFIPTDAQYFSHYAATTQVTVRIIDLNTNVELYTDSMVEDIFVDDVAHFQFSWTPSAEGEYRIIAESRVIDNQVDPATAYPEYDTIEYIVVFNPDDLADACFAALPDGIALLPFEPVAGSQATIYGLKTANHFNDQLIPSPIDAWMYVEIEDSNGVDVFSDSQYLFANQDPAIPEQWEFAWTPADVGQYTMWVGIYPTDADCASQTPEVHSLTFTVTGQPRGNTMPIITRLPDMNVPINTTPMTMIDLWAYTRDAETPSDQLMYTMAETNPAALDVSLVGNRYLVFGQATVLGDNMVTVTASDGDLTAISTFRVSVVEPTSPPPPEADDFGDWILIEQFALRSGDELSVYDLPRLSITLRNNGNDLEDLKITAIIPDLDARGSAGPFEIDHNEEVTRNIILDMPDAVEPGEYLVRLVVSDSRGTIYRAKHRTITFT